MKKIILFIGVLFCVSLLFSCSNSSSSNDSLIALLAGGKIFNGTTTDTDDPSDDVGTITFDSTVTIDFAAQTAESSGSSYSYASDAVVFTNDGGATSVTVQTSTFGVTVTSTVTDEVQYILTGTLAGTFTVNSGSAYQLYLDTVTITGASDGGPALDLESPEKVYIVTAEGTTNTLADNSSRDDDMEQKAALYGKGAMIFSGTGTLNTTYNYKHGIYSGDYIRVCSGTINVNSANTTKARDGIRTVNALIFDDGTLTINANGQKTDDESKGIKIEGDDNNASGAGKGYIIINGGTITITSYGKAITAGWDVDEDLGTNTSGNPDPYVEINGGTVTVTTTGIPYENESGSNSPEGIEAKSTLTINDGIISIDATEDGLNAGSSIAINGGKIYCKGDTDAIDSNGTLNISGGVIVAVGGSNPEGPFDCDGRTALITGGILVGIGGQTSQPSATQYTVALNSSTYGTSTMALRNNSSGETEFAFSIPTASSVMVFSSPAITSGSHSVYTGATVGGYDNLFHGLYYGNLTSSGGTSRRTFTISSYVSNPYNISYSFN